MKIKDALKPSNVSVIKQEENPYCINCNRLKIKHSRDQTENCVRAIYLRA